MGDMTPEERLARIEVQLAGLNQRLDEVVISQLRDHGKRIQALENRGVWVAGWIAGAGIVAGGVATLVTLVVKATV